MKRLSCLGLVALLMIMCVGSALAATTYVGISTGGTSGTYFPLGGDIAALWMNNLKNLDVTATASGGSKDNILQIDRQEAEMGTVQNDVMYYAAQGDEVFFDGEVIDSFRTVGSLYPELIQIVVGADSGIDTIADLKGLNVGVGAVNSGVYFNAVQVLETAGLTIDDIKPHYLSFAESATSFQNQQIDAFFITSGLPNTAIVEVANKRDVQLLGLDEEAMAALMAKYPFYTPVVVEAGTYNGMTKTVTTPAVAAVLICSKDMDEQLVYDMTKVLYEQTDELSHAKKVEISAESAVKGIPVPFHPGAERYFVEKGLIDAQ